MSILRREKRRIYARKIKGFWQDFSHNKIGIVGLAVIFFFVGLAIFSPILAPEDPIYQKKVASKYAVPSWITIFDPAYRNAPPTTHFPFNATIAPENQTCPTITIEYPETSDLLKIKYVNNGTFTNQTYIFEVKFDYNYDQPRDWTLRTSWKSTFSNLDYRFEIYFERPDGNEWIIWGRDYDVVTKRIKVLPHHWNTITHSMVTGAGSTELLRRIYYEKFYEERYLANLEKYPFQDLVFDPQHITFTNEGFRIETSLPILDNPIYNLYAQRRNRNETALTWEEYWTEWIDSEEANEMWELISEYLAENWVKFAEERKVENITQVLENSTRLNQHLSENMLFRQWYNERFRYGSQRIPWRNLFDWNEFYTIFNLTLTTVKDDYDVFFEAMNKTDSPAYERWENKSAQLIQYANEHDTEITWDTYLEAWISIQWWYAKQPFINQYIKALTVGPEIVERNAHAEAYSLAASSPRPLYFLAQKGTQTLKLYLTIIPKTENATLDLAFSTDSQFTVWGTVYGLLGATSFGFDVWTQVAHGARISLIVGSLAAILSTSLGILFGVTSGYVGGIADEATMRIVDILLCLPVLPLLLALAAIWKPNVYYLVLIIAIFGWQGLSRVIRSKTLSLREMPFVESARASGASSSYLIIRHLIPNVFPIAMASLVLSVPGAILTEAALSYLGFGDPFAPTWGRMLHQAQSEGAFGSLIWHYILPPGFAIVFLCVAFVFIGHALDEIVNPRLRRRR